jgi:transcriptional regulator with XRE-family HTH domain
MDAATLLGMDNLNAQVSRAMDSLMKDHNITQAQVARMLGRSESYVSARVHGKKPLPLDILGAVAEAAHMSPRAVLVEITERMARPGATAPE